MFTTQSVTQPKLHNHTHNTIRHMIVMWLTRDLITRRYRLCKLKCFRIHVVDLFRLNSPAPLCQQALEPDSRNQLQLQVVTKKHIRFCSEASSSRLPRSALLPLASRPPTPMARPTILIVGATGNTGKSVVRELPGLLQSTGESYRIVGLTRSLDNATSLQLAALPHIEMVEKDWTTIDADWLKSQGVVRAFVAPHNLPHQFAEESGLYAAMLSAGVKYVVRVSTNAEYIGPTNPVYYGRAHWAIENLLSQPEFKSLQFTSLQPNFFTISYLASAVDWVKAYQKTGKKELLAIVPGGDAAVAMIDPEDVGNIGAHLLSLTDPTPHNQARYVLSGPESVTGKRIVEVAEKYAGVKVDEVEFESTTWLRELAKVDAFAKALPSFLAGCEPLWQGKCALSVMPTSPEIMALAPPKRTISDAMEAMLRN
jgi:uncharacterized protein YbjT (DUF2867 family)